MPIEALRIEGLSKDFGGLRVLRDISLTIEAGERTAIIGPNGAGKTTLFNVITGELSATAGHVYIFGQEISTMPAHRCAHVGLARSFQITRLFSNLTVLQNILLALQGIKHSRYQMFRPITAYKDLFAKAQELLGLIDLWEKRNDPVKAISYGEQRKLEIALSLASDPKLLLLDEPSSGLTAAESNNIIDMIRNLGSDITAVIVAHDMDLIFGVADRIIVLHYGQIIAEGTPEEIQADPRVREIYMGIGEGRVNAGAG